MEDVLAIRDEYRLQEWSQIIQAGQNSGLSKREFCRQNGISERQYYYWLRPGDGGTPDRHHQRTAADPQKRLKPLPVMEKNMALPIRSAMFFL